MEKYNYLESVKEDVREYIEEQKIDIHGYEYREDLEEMLNDDLWSCDYITGNASGSYTMNTWQAEENICHNLDLLAEACLTFGFDLGQRVGMGAETCDVTIRCYLLPQAISEVLDDMEVK